MRDYAIGVDLEIIIRWRSPPKGHREQIERELAQQNLNHKAQLFAHEIVKKLNDQGYIFESATNGEDHY